MSRTSIAMFVGLLLGITAAFGTLLSFVVVVLFGAIGLVIGMIIDGKIDVQALIGRATDRR